MIDKTVDTTIEALKRQIASLSAYPPELYAALKAFSVTPAPSGFEAERTELALKALEAAGVKNSFVDEVGNLIIPFGNLSEGPISVFMGHSDVVFPDRGALPWTEDGTWIYCPGIGDNDCHAAAVAAGAVFMTRYGLTPQRGAILLVINVGEEGLGNLKGARAVVDAYGSRIKSMVTFDSVLPTVINEAVGSKRYRITAKTEGGHSFTAFGNANAIEKAAGLIQKLYGQSVPACGKTTYNVGLIEGGTSVNTIAQEASLLYEFRSNRYEAMAVMDKQFAAIMKAVEDDDVDWHYEVIGERPCMEGVDDTAMTALMNRGMEAIRQYYGEEPFLSMGSTDANVFLAKGIPAIGLGCCRGMGTHTREERIRKDSLLPGLKVALSLIIDSLEDHREVLM